MGILEKYYANPFIQGNIVSLYREGKQKFIGFQTPSAYDMSNGFF